MFEAESDDLRTIKALPLWMGFVAAVIAPIIIALVFAILGAQKNALLLQLELIVVAIAFCLTGILTRSKLLGLLSIIAAPISWVVLFFASTFTGGWFVNPYGLLSELAGPLTSLAKSDLIPPEYAGLMNTIVQIAIIADLVILEIMALFLGFFLSTLATGIWTKKGELSILSVIVKPIAAVFTIIILLTVPLAYHGIANFADGGVSLVAGTGELYSAFGGELGVPGGGGAQAEIPFDLGNQTVLKQLTEACQRASEWFTRSAYKFDHVQGNFYTRILMQLLPDLVQMEGINVEKLDMLLDIADILAIVAEEAPNLILGYYYLTDGFDRTFSILGESDIGGGFGGSTSITEATYDPEFNAGLENISTAIDYFDDSREGVEEALESAIDIVDEVFTGEGGFGDVTAFIEESQIGYGLILYVAEAAVDFLNATYKTILAVEDLGDSDFEGAHQWMGDASNDLSDANDTLRGIDTSDLDPDSVLPFWGTVEIIADMTELLTYFAKAATNGTECYMEIEDIVVALNAIDFGSDDLLTISEDLNNLSSEATNARITFAGARYNIGNATELSDSFNDKSYGEIIDGSLKPMLIDFGSMLEQFETNVTEISHLLTALDFTLLSAYSFTEGLNLFNSTYNAIRLAAGDNGTIFFESFSVDPNIDKSIAYMDYAIENATDGFDEIGFTSVISPAITVAWKNTLHYPWPPEDPDSGLNATVKSIAGLATGAKDAINTLKAATAFLAQEASAELINDLFDQMDAVGFTQIFGG
ncbi:MAG: hypothetical protein JSW11_18990 [Candidatus Heimdallarchaeota archaeon]|nr:MAG: hypothetical protein JSW11_18990 [Candidatus Heimdallarchaeota archaeon]